MLLQIISLIKIYEGLDLAIEPGALNENIVQNH